MTQLTEAIANNKITPVVVLLLLCIICYSNSINAPFVFDDYPNIVDNEWVHVDELKLENLHRAGFKSLMPSRPLANISFALNYYFDELNVKNYHLVNITIHFINGFLVYLFSMIIFGQMTIKKHSTGIQLNSTEIVMMSLFAAAIFVSHPVQIQSVTYIVQRMNSLATMFYLTSLMFYLKGRISTQVIKRCLLYAICLASFALALACKEISATLPAAILLLEWFLFQDAQVTNFKKNTVLIAIMVTVIGIASIYFLGGDPVERILSDYRIRNFTIGERLLTEGRVIIFYISLLFLPFPSRLNLLHNFEISHSLLMPISTIFAILFLVLIVIYSITIARRHRLLLFCTLWFFLHLLIESSFIGLEIIFEHRLYLPMVGFSLAISYFLFYIFKTQFEFRNFVIIVLITLLSVGTYQRNLIWADSNKLWSDVIEKNSDSYRGYYSLANDYLEKGLLNEAITHYQKAIEIKPNYAKAYNNLGIALKTHGNLGSAVQQYSLAIFFNPEDSKTYYNIAIALDELGDVQRAVTEYKNAISKNPEYTQAYYNLGNVYDRLGNKSEAKFHFQEAIRLLPTHTLANNNLGIILASEGLFEEAISKFENAIESHPEFHGAYINSGNAYLSINNIKKACQYFKTSIEINPELSDLSAGIKQECKL
ncbi:MAG: tetratricopeptide (TPR) repeat protein [Gammaproteobacteria bacterium]|jgi:tetratricopeptide (TPR) repeat protein